VWFLQILGTVEDHVCSYSKPLVVLGLPLLLDVGNKSQVVG
jgi:hypothetical protein